MAGRREGNSPPLPLDGKRFGKVEERGREKVARVRKGKVKEI